MNQWNSSYTGRAPRTLNSAFGPYTSRDFVEDMPPTKKAFVALYIAAIVILAILAVCH